MADAPPKKGGLHTRYTSDGPSHGVSSSGHPVGNRDGAAEGDDADTARSPNQKEKR